jgi:hypothetical protein
MKNLAFILPVVLYLMFLLPSQASATVLFAGGKDADFVCGGTTAVCGNSSFHDNSFARQSVYVGMVNSGVTDPPVSYYSTPVLTSSSTVWFHTYLSAETGAATNNAQVLRALSPDGVARILVRSTGTTGTYKISKRNAAGTITDLVTASTNCGDITHHAFDLYINYATSGEVTLYCNNTAIADYSGDVTTDSATQLNQFQLASAYLGSSSASYSTQFSEVIVSMADTRNLRLVSLKPSANGNADTWDTGGVANINEGTLSDNTLNASGTAGQIQEYTIDTTKLANNNLTIQDVWVNARAQVDTTGPQHIQAMVRTGNTDYTSSDLSPTQGSWTTVATDWTINPNTGVAWTTGDLSAAGFNIGFKSTN